MVDLDATGVAERAGVELAYVTRPVELDLLTVGSDGSIPDGQLPRVQMLQVLER